MNTLNLLETDSSPEIHFEKIVFQRKIRNLNQKKCLQEKRNLVKQNNFGITRFAIWKERI